MISIGLPVVATRGEPARCEYVSDCGLMRPPFVVTEVEDTGIGRGPGRSIPERLVSIGERSGRKTPSTRMDGKASWWSSPEGSTDPWRRTTLPSSSSWLRACRVLAYRLPWPPAHEENFSGCYTGTGISKKVSPARKTRSVCGKRVKVLRCSACASCSSDGFRDVHQEFAALAFYL